MDSTPHPSTSINQYPILPVPFSKTPAEELQKDVQRLNENDTIPLEQRWREYADFLTRYLSTLRAPSSDTTTLLPSAAETDTTPALSAAAEGRTLDEVNTVSLGTDETNSSKLRLLLHQALSLLPKKYYLQATKLIVFLDHNDVKFSSKGELMNKDNGEHIKGSNIVDFIHYMYRPRVTVKEPPHGWSVFLQMLYKLNAPKELLGRFRNTPQHHLTRTATTTKQVEARPSDTTFVTTRDVVVYKPSSSSIDRTSNYSRKSPVKTRQQQRK